MVKDDEDVVMMDDDEGVVADKEILMEEENVVFDAVAVYAYEDVEEVFDVPAVIVVVVYDELV